MSNETKHTPGPWNIVDDAPGVMAPKINARDTSWTIARLVRQSGPSEDNANARLIAAAPDLLAACKALMDPTRLQDAIDLALAAIARAEGGK